MLFGGVFVLFGLFFYFFVRTLLSSRHEDASNNSWFGRHRGRRLRYRKAAPIRRESIRAEQLVGKRIGRSGDSENSRPLLEHLVGCRYIGFFLGQQTQRRIKKWTVAKIRDSVSSLGLQGGRNEPSDVHSEIMYLPGAERLRRRAAGFPEQEVER
jgi:hypothetical protein